MAHIKFPLGLLLHALAEALQECGFGDANATRRSPARGPYSTTSPSRRGES